MQVNAHSIKAIFFDVDGTLLDNRTHRIPESAKKALGLARERGILLFVATGRHKHGVEQIPGLRDLGFSGYVTLNGQYCYCDDRVIYTNPIDRADVEEMVGFLENHTLPCMFLETDRVYINMVNDAVRAAHGAVNSSIPPVEDPRRALTREILQMGLYMPNDHIPTILKRMRHCATTKWMTNGIDLIPRSGSKRVGIAHMLDHFRLSPKEIMAFGDSENDLEMLESAGISVAMGNAIDSVKSVSDYITEAVDRDGVASAMRRLLQLEE